MKDLEKPIVDIKTKLSEEDEFELEVIPLYNISSDEFENNGIDERLNELESSIYKRNEEIEKLESHADKLDCVVAASCGILTGILDALFVGEFSFKDANQWGTEKCNKFVLNFANKAVANDSRFDKGFEFDELSKAIEYLESKYKVNYDVANSVMGGGDHHLYDFAHHPSPLGLIISVVSQLSGKTYGWNTKLGKYAWVDVTNSNAKVGGSNIFEKFFNAIINWSCHLISDMAGSSTAKNGGAGIPGPIMSMLQEGAVLFKKSDPNLQVSFQKFLNDAYKGKLKGQNGVPFDLRTELGVYKHIGKQSLVVIINEIIVRAFYMIRRIIQEIKENSIKTVKELKNIKWMNVLPVKNRSVVRMLAISMTTLTAIDIAEAGIRAAIESSGNGYIFLSKFAFGINYIGVARTIIVDVTDGIMGAKLERNRNKRIEELNEYISLYNLKLFYKQGDLWTLAEDVDKSIEQAMEKARQSIKLFEKSFIENKKDIKKISYSIDKADEKNEGLKDDIKNILKWGE